jgi:hypothetical protein
MRNPRVSWVLAALLAAACAGKGQPARVGGCDTTERDYGLPVLADSAAGAALAELTAPGSGSKIGPVCRALGVDTPLFAQVGSVAPLADEEWRAAVQVLCARLDSAGVRIAERSLLRHTVGPCFPPYHVDLRGCGTTAGVATFLDSLAVGPWTPYAVTSERRGRRLFVAAGRELSLMNVAVDLR